MKRNKCPKRQITKRLVPSPEIVVYRYNSDGIAIEGAVRYPRMASESKIDAQVSELAKISAVVPNPFPKKRVNLNDLSAEELAAYDSENGLIDLFIEPPVWEKVVDYKDDLKVRVNPETAFNFWNIIGKNLPFFGVQDEAMKQALTFATRKLSNSLTLDPRRFTWEQNNVSVLEGIGRGSYGLVFAGVLKDGKQVAIKQFKPETRYTEIWRERDMLIHLKHKRILNLQGAFYELGAYLVLDRCFGSVAQFAHCISTRQKVRFAIHLLEAVNWIHSKNIIHCDIRPENCLITLENTLVLGDFGNSQLLPKCGYLRSLRKMLSNVGFSDFYSIKGHFYSKASDMFGVGCTLYFMDKGNHLCLYEPGIVTESNESTEYAKVAREGRLPRGTDNAIDLNGKRVPLHIRAESSMFSEIIKFMVKDSYKRRSASYCLLHDSLQRLVLQEQIDVQHVDNDDDIGGLCNKSDLTLEFSKQEKNSVLEMALHMLYFDEELTSNKESCAHSASNVSAQGSTDGMQFYAIELDKLLKFVDDNSVLVIQTPCPPIANDAAITNVEEKEAQTDLPEKLPSKAPEDMSLPQCVQSPTTHTQVLSKPADPYPTFRKLPAVKPAGKLNYGTKGLGEENSSTTAKNSLQHGELRQSKKDKKLPKILKPNVPRSPSPVAPRSPSPMASRSVSPVSGSAGRKRGSKQRHQKKDYTAVDSLLNIDSSNGKQPPAKRAKSADSSSTDVKGQRLGEKVVKKMKSKVPKNDSNVSEKGSKRETASLKGDQIAATPKQLSSKKKNEALPMPFFNLLKNPRHSTSANVSDGNVNKDKVPTPKVQIFFSCRSPCKEKRPTQDEMKLHKRKCSIYKKYREMERNVN